jgi:L-histidine N-alpha-methyltransferase
MNYQKEEVISTGRISITNQLQEIGSEEMVEELIAGLRQDQKAISSKYFYNRTGSILFKEITRLEEYYPTRTEKSILKKIAPDLMKKYKEYEIIELGPGDHSKVSILLSAASNLNLSSLHYLPLDISQAALRVSAEELVSTFPNLHVEGYTVDFLSQLDTLKRERPALICFFGSTIGNFEWATSVELLLNISSQMKKNDILLLGMDMVKAEHILHAAYNDASGVTEMFNKNILNSVNDLIESDFHTEDFDHMAFYNKKKSRVEMHLAARRDIKIHSVNFRVPVSINRGETIHTENSYKYHPRDIQKIASETGLSLNKTYSDERRWFTLSEFRKV